MYGIVREFLWGPKPYTSIRKIVIVIGLHNVIIFYLTDRLRLSVFGKIQFANHVVWNSSNKKIVVLLYGFRGSCWWVVFVWLVVVEGKCAERDVHLPNTPPKKNAQKYF